MGAGGLLRNAFLAAGFAFACVASDWPQFRGSNHNGTSSDRIFTNWSGALTNPIWRVSLTNALCSLAVSDGKVFTQARRAIEGVSREVCVALSATNGVELWATSLDNAFYPGGGVGFDDGPRSTPTVVGGSVFVLTSYLKVYRLNAATGAIVWQKDLVALYGSTVIAWQNAASPVVADGLIYLNANTTSSSLMAFHISDGSLAWRAQIAGLTHSTPTLATIHGVHQLIFATQQGLVSVNPANGNLFWRTNYPFTYSTSLAASPVVWEDVVFITAARVYNMGSVAYQVQPANGAWSVTRLWWNNATASHWMTPVCQNGFLYGPFGIFLSDGTNAQFNCVELRTGAVRWQVPGFGRGGTLLMRDQLVGLNEHGVLLLIQADPTAYRELGRFRTITNYDRDSNKCWNLPAIADGKIYVRSTAMVAAFDLSNPALKLEPPQFTSPARIQLTVTTENGSPISTNRAAGIEIFTATNTVEPLTAWSKLTNDLLWTNGRARVDNFEASAPRRFFIAREPQ
jgi:outer membrane protein assembly factor BamB